MKRTVENDNTREGKVIIAVVIKYHTRNNRKKHNCNLTRQHMAYEKNRGKKAIQE